MNLSVAQEASIIVLGVVIWFALVVPRYAVSIDLRVALETKTRKAALSAYSGNIFEVSCVIWGGCSGIFVGVFVTTTSYWFVLLAAFVGMVLIGIVSTLILHAKTGENTLEMPGKVVLFLVAGTSIFWAGALLMHWTLNPGTLPMLSTFKGIAEIVGVVVSLLSVIVFFWERMPMRARRRSK